MVATGGDADQKITPGPLVTVSMSVLGVGSCARALRGVMPLSVNRALCFCSSFLPQSPGADRRADLYFLCDKTTACAL